MKKIKVMSIALSFALCMISLTACSKQGPATISSAVIKINDKTISWQPVSAAVNYEVLINDESKYFGTECSYRLNELPQSTTIVCVKTYSSKNLTSLSNKLTLNNLAKPEVTLINDHIIVWGKVEGADSYTLKVGNQVTLFNNDSQLEYELDKDMLTVSSDQLSDIIIRLTASSTNSSLYDSVVDLSPSKEKLATPAPIIYGARLEWIKIPNALSYDVTIGDNDAITVTDNYYLFESCIKATISVTAKGLWPDMQSDKSAIIDVKIDELSMFNTALDIAKNYKSVKIDASGSTTANAPIIGKQTQSTAGQTIINHNLEVISHSLSYGTFKKFGYQFYHQYGSDSVYKRSKEPNENLTITWGSVRGSAMTVETYTSTYGRSPFDFFGYLVTADTIKSIDTALHFDQTTQSYKFSLSLNLSGTQENVKQVIDFGGLSGCTYKSCRLTFEINKEMKLLTCVINDNYEAVTEGVIKVKADTTTTTKQVYSYYNEFQTIDSSWIIV